MNVIPITIETLCNDLNELLNSHRLEQLFSLKTPAPFQGSFIFPKTPDYCMWLCETGEEIKKQKSILYLYNQIVDREDIPVAPEAVSKINGVYIIAEVESDGEILYIGKSGANFKEDGNDLVINRILDHFVPKQFNKMQNTPPLWDRISTDKKNVLVCYWSGLDRLAPSLLELYLLNLYYQGYKTQPRLNGRRGRKSKTPYQFAPADG